MQMDESLDCRQGQVGLLILVISIGDVKLSLGRVATVGETAFQFLK